MAVKPTRQRREKFWTDQDFPHSDLLNSHHWRPCTNLTKNVGTHTWPSTVGSITSACHLQNPMLQIFEINFKYLFNLHYTSTCQQVTHPQCKCAELWFRVYHRRALGKLWNDASWKAMLKGLWLTIGGDGWFCFNGKESGVLRGQRAETRGEDRRE